MKQLISFLNSNITIIQNTLIIDGCWLEQTPQEGDNGYKTLPGHGLIMTKEKKQHQHIIAIRAVFSKVYRN